jgi:tetracycline 7-halogenase / FADH2 O2-dependent halogenase
LPKRTTDHDVVILGSGLAGSMIAACLARNGVDVLIVDAGQHPRFAVGESTIPYTSMMMRLVSERYGVPEIKRLTSFESVQAKVSTSCGVKRNFGFVYHRAGQPHNHAEANGFPIPKVTHTENHFFRQDTDQWMLAVAVRYGARVKQRARVSDVRIDADGATLTLPDGEVTARFVIDASGHRSPLAAAFNLRETPTRLRTHSRSLFTHMINVKPYEDVVTPPGAHHNPSPWSQGTLHHLFSGGWMWVIPFNNHPRSTNPLCSVGICLDPRVHPKPEGTAQEEFYAFLRQFPEVRKQFVDAKPVRNWVSTDRLQYSSSRTIGPRWCLTSHAAGFVDALFSRGLENTMEIINSLVVRVLDALREDDFDTERFEYVQELEQGLLDFNDNLVANAYTSFQNWDLWNAWCRVWMLGQILSTCEVNRAYAKFLDDPKTPALDLLASLEPSGSLPDYAPLRELYRGVGEAVQEVQEGHLDAGVAAGRIFTMLQSADFVPPAFSFGDPDNRWFDHTIPRVTKTLRWAKTEAPPEIGDLLYEGLTLFSRKRFARGEFMPLEEIKHLLAARPVLGKRLRSAQFQ